MCAAGSASKHLTMRVESAGFSLHGSGGSAGVLQRLEAQFPPCVQLFGGRVLAGDADAGWLELEFEVPEVYAHGLGVQGGILAGLIDNAMAQAVILATGFTRRPPMLEMKTSYLRGGPPGRFVARGDVLLLGRSITFLEGTLRDPEGHLLAKASATAELIPYG